MIYVSEKQLHQVEYLIGQSKMGHHPLFNVDTIRKIFRQGTRIQSYGDYCEKHAIDGVEGHIEKLIMQPTLTQKITYLERLDAATYEQVMRTYFNIVENNIMESEQTRH